MVNVALLVCVLRATTKKVVNFFEENKYMPREKILATPMSFYVLALSRYINVISIQVTRWRHTVSRCSSGL